MSFTELKQFIWNIADKLLRSKFKAHDYGDVILPFIVLRRLDCVLKPTKRALLDFYNRRKDSVHDKEQLNRALRRTTSQQFFNTSQYDFETLVQDANNIEINFLNYIDGFDDNVKDILDNFKIRNTIKDLVKKKILFQLIEDFSKLDFSPGKVDNQAMGGIFEELIRRFAEQSNETAGEHFTPRDVVSLLIQLLFDDDIRDLQPGAIRNIYDPTSGTMGMPIMAYDYLAEKVPHVKVNIFGQELNESSYAIAKSDALISGHNPDHIQQGNTLTEDKFPNHKFHYQMSNPPYGVTWKDIQKLIIEDRNKPISRFKPGLPRSSDGSLLFLMHMISKMDPDIISNIGIVLNGSPLFTGDAGSGESDIRKWIIEQDLIEAIVALPGGMFYNTGIGTYIWILNNKKPEERKGKIQLIDARGFSRKMKKALGAKSNQITEEHQNQITELYSKFEDNEYSKILNNSELGYTKVVVERPLLDADGSVITDKKGNIKVDTKKRDYERIPLGTDIDQYFIDEVKPYLADAWFDRTKDKIGYKINFNQFFYKPEVLRPLEEVEAEIFELEAEINQLLTELK